MVKNFSLFLYNSQLRHLLLQTLVIFCSASPFYYAAASLQHLQRPSSLIHLRCRVSSPGPYFLCCSLALVSPHGIRCDPTRAHSPLPPCPASPPSLNNHSPYRPSHRKFHHSHSIRYLMPLRLPPTPHTRKDSSTLLVEFKYANRPPTLFCLRTPHRTTNLPLSPPQYASLSFYSLVSLAEAGAPIPLVEFKFRIQTRPRPCPRPRPSQDSPQALRAKVLRGL